MIKCPDCGSTAQVKSSGIKRVNPNTIPCECGCGCYFDYYYLTNTTKIRRGNENENNRYCKKN